METMEDVIADLQAAAVVQGQMIRALIATHPDLQKLKANWEARAAILVADGATRSAGGAQGHATGQAIVERVARLQREIDSAVRARGSQPPSGNSG